jgi:hypothetical protein
VEESQATKRRTIGRDTIRSHLVLEVASELVDRPGWPYRQARINLREQGGETGRSVCSAATLPQALKPMANLDATQPTLFDPPSHRHIKQLSSCCATVPVRARFTKPCGDGGALGQGMNDQPGSGKKRKRRTRIFLGIGHLGTRQQ